MVPMQTYGLANQQNGVHEGNNVVVTLVDQLQRPLLLVGAAL